MTDKPVRDYVLEIHPTVAPIPISLLETQDGRPVRCVALLKRDAASATLEEAQAMLDALRRLL